MNGVQFCKIKSLLLSFRRYLNTNWLSFTPNWEKNNSSSRCSASNMVTLKSLFEASLSDTHTHAYKDGMKWNTYWMGRLQWSDAERRQTEKRKRKMNENEMMSSWWTVILDETLELNRNFRLWSTAATQVYSELIITITWINWMWSGYWNKVVPKELNSGRVRGGLMSWIWIYRWRWEVVFWLICGFLQYMVSKLPLGMTSSFCCKILLVKCMYACARVCTCVFIRTNKHCVSVCKCMHVAIVCERMCADRCQKCRYRLEGLLTESTVTE